MSGDHYRLLVKRAQALRSVAEDLLARSEYDLAVFNAEQAAQLRLKAALYRLWGLTPRSHSIKWLPGLPRNCPVKAGLPEAAGRIDEFVGESRGPLAALEDAHTLTGYGHLEYDRETASKLVPTAKRLWRLVEALAAGVGEAGAGED